MLGDVVANHAGEKQSMVWGRLCELLAGTPGVSGINLLIDTQALEQVGLHADTVSRPVAREPGSSEETLSSIGPSYSCSTTTDSWC